MESSNILVWPLNLNWTEIFINQLTIYPVCCTWLWNKQFMPCSKEKTLKERLFLRISQRTQLDFESVLQWKWFTIMSITFWRTLLSTAPLAMSFVENPRSRGFKIGQGTLLGELMGSLKVHWPPPSPEHTSIQKLKNTMRKNKQMLQLKANPPHIKQNKSTVQMAINCG